MAERNKTFGINVQLMLKASDEFDLLKATQEACQDGLLEPGFIEDFVIIPEDIIEIE